MWHEQVFQIILASYEMQSIRNISNSEMAEFRAFKASQMQPRHQHVPGAQPPSYNARGPSAAAPSYHAARDGGYYNSVPSNAPPLGFQSVKGADDPVPDDVIST